MTKKRYTELVGLINQYNTEYYQYDNSSIPDDEWDKLYAEYLDLEEKNPSWKGKDAPSLRVGGNVLENIPKGKHTVPPLSLDKSKEMKRLEKFFQDVFNEMKKNYIYKVTFTVEPKMDGLTIIIRYENGVLVRVLTRGQDGIGEMVTEQVKTIRSIPLVIPHKDTIEFHGEAYMKRSVLKEINEKREQEFIEELNASDHELSNDELVRLQEKYKPLNERNGAAGSIRQLDTKVTASRKLDAFFYHIPYAEGITFESQQEMMKFMKAQGLKVNPIFYIVNSLKECQTALKKIEEVRDTLDYAIDGGVIKIDDINLRNKMGFTEKYPKGAIAWKYSATEVMTDFNDLICETGRTGVVTPVGLLEPVEINGATVSRATLNNFKNIIHKGIKLHSKVIVRRSGDVIPEILRCIPTSDSFEIVPPTHCPSCGGELTEVGDLLYCLNHEDCPSQQVNKIIHFASRGAMNIDGLGDETIELLFSKGLIKHFIDLYSLKKETLLELDGFQEKKADNVINAIQDSIKQPFERVLFGLGIRHIGKKTAKILIKHYPTIDLLSNANINELIQIHEIGEKIANKIALFFQNAKNKELIQTMKKIGFDLGVEKKHDDNPIVINPFFDGKTFVVTGKFNGFNRDDITKLIEEQGGKVSGSVSKNTSYLVAGYDAGSKLSKAEDINKKGGHIEIISIEKLSSLLSK